MHADAGVYNPVGHGRSEVVAAQECCGGTGNGASQLQGHAWLCCHHRPREEGVAALWKAIGSALHHQSIYSGLRIGKEIKRRKEA
ncbi:hypothetical protein FCM35_KLT06529 [Carex littledalei]|uniref:Uncharacterized protein n=1 Tax=Carex littledalei TaxID=544730 RepID=A0A833R078_9POAL|nr:hypothetical protein FCM35_KLT06529 [Carex littledalei]